MYIIKIFAFGALFREWSDGFQIKVAKHKILVNKYVYWRQNIQSSGFYWQLIEWLNALVKAEIKCNIYPSICPDMLPFIHSFRTRDILGSALALTQGLHTPDIKGLIT